MGLLEGGSGISWAVMNKTIVGWVMTLVVVGLLSALIMALGVFTPNLNASNALTKIKGQVNEVGFAQADNLALQCSDAQDRVLVRHTPLSSPRTTKLLHVLRQQTVVQAHAFRVVCFGVACRPVLVSSLMACSWAFNACVPCRR